MNTKIQSKLDTIILLVTVNSDSLRPVLSKFEDFGAVNAAKDVRDYIKSCTDFCAKLQKVKTPNAMYDLASIAPASDNLNNVTSVLYDLGAKQLEKLVTTAGNAVDKTYEKVQALSGEWTRANEKERVAKEKVVAKAAAAKEAAKQKKLAAKNKKNKKKTKDKPIVKNGHNTTTVPPNVLAEGTTYDDDGDMSMSD